MKYRFLTLISSLLLLTACSDSFLERAPEGNYVDVTFYTSDKALQAATAPLYNRAWFDLNQRSIVPLGSNRADPRIYQLQGNGIERQSCRCLERILFGHHHGKRRHQ